MYQARSLSRPRALSFALQSKFNTYAAVIEMSRRRISASRISVLNANDNWETSDNLIELTSL